MSPVVQMLGRALDWYFGHRNGFDLLGLLLSVMGTLFAVLSICAPSSITSRRRNAVRSRPT
jgi:hypothetical protein